MAEPLFELLFDDFANTDRRLANQKHYRPEREPEPETFETPPVQGEKAGQA
jgi:hypothetical protein